MATAAPTQNLPLFYNSIEPLNATQHGKMKVRPIEKSPVIGTTHAIPVTVDEFGLAQRHYPIVFSVGDMPVPIALMGLNEGVNVFLDGEGRALDPSVYLPGLHPPLSVPARAPQSAERRTVAVLRFRRRARSVTSRTGEALFDGDQPSAATKAILEFCEQFETAGQRTSAFVEELKKSGLLMDGEVAIQPEGFEQPFVYRGFQMIDEEKLREPARRRASQDEPERHAAAHLRAPLLAGADARRVRSPASAGQGADAGAAAGACDA